MAKTSKVTASKTDKVVELARRRTGVSGAEIMEATGWPVGNAKAKVAYLAESRGFKAVRYDRPDGVVAWRLAGKAA